MEQKQLDDDESFFGEEFLDEDVISDSASEQNYSVKSGVKPERGRKKSAKKTKVSKSSSRENAPDVSIDDEESESSKSYSSSKDEGYVEIKPANEPETKEEFTAKDPWADDGDEEGKFFKEVSTWKAITGIVVILLIFSVFTQGFQFSKAEGISSSEMLITEAEQKALDFVNGNLLQPPFLAEIKSSEDTGNLYKVTLSVAGQDVDSYITKDGKLFFPQGFDTSEGLISDEAESDLSQPEQPVEAEEEIEEAKENIEEGLSTPETESSGSSESGEVSGDVSGDKSADEETAGGVPAEEPSGPKEVEIAMQAMKWRFEISGEILPRITMKKGDKVKLFIEPSPGLEFTFAVPDFGIEKEVKGVTAVEFTVDKAGRFKFFCSSCEARRGMEGLLIVE